MWGDVPEGDILFQVSWIKPFDLFPTRNNYAVVNSADMCHDSLHAPSVSARHDYASAEMSDNTPSYKMNKVMYRVIRVKPCTNREHFISRNWSRGTEASIRNNKGYSQPVRDHEFVFPVT